MDRDGFGSRSDAVDSDRDADDDSRTDGDRHALDSKPDPQPDSVDHHGHHHPDRHIYPNLNANCDQYFIADAIPASHGYLYIHIHSVCNLHCNAYVYAFCHEYFYPHGFGDTSECDTDPIPYLFPNHIPII